MADKGRKPGFRMSEDHRVKIKNSNILNALIEHVEGKREMSATQVSAGLGLLRKVMPDLAATQITGKDEGPIQTQEVGTPRDEIHRRIIGIASRTGKEEDTRRLN